MMPTVCAIDGLEAIVDPKPWEFAETCRDEIAAFWAKTHASQPRLFDGEILLQHDWRIVGGIYRARYTIVRYSAFLAWRALGHPGAPMRNGFGMAALRAADGAFLLGQMAAHTANPGMVYFAAGTPDRDDIIDGRVDLAGSVQRELQEETGLRADEFVIEPRWTLVEDGVRAAFMRPARLHLPADEARMLMLSRMAELADDELSDIVIVARRSDLDPARMPAFMLAYLESELEQ